MDTGGMSEDIFKLFQMVKIELEKQTVTITENVTANLMRVIDDKIQPIIEENNSLKFEIQSLNRKIKYLEDANRRNNIIIHGIKESESNYKELYDIICLNLQNTEIHVGKFEINRFHRLGRKEEGKARPILIALTSYQKKIEILKNKSKMPEHIYITEDLSKETIALRKNLQQQLKLEKEKGNVAYIKNNKVIIKETRDKGKRKRDLSLSPANILTPTRPTDVAKNVSAPPKLHKVDAFAYMRARSHSLTEKGVQQPKA
ncbi:PREDICTED: uncharacterized protein LOC106111610 [Papilio polytes]|uniref:uncharacterized protein LOC106111610 n=1 Tax=Papilio polytes TaxID=76194 RepID=UPI0006769528|nr:PREDICTED: uncharacterized protein LOC106111610 [Papilio polytes]